MESTVTLFFVFIFGTIVGSFLNVVILRFNTGKGIGGRSGCFTCSKTLHYYELIPIISFIALRGRCSGCKSKISIQYPIVELATGILFTFLCYRILNLGFVSYYSVFGILYSLFLPFVLWSSLLVIFVYDVKHKIIPDFFSVLFFGCSALLTIGAWYESGDITVLYQHVGAGILLFSFFFGLWFVSKGRWMGLSTLQLYLELEEFECLDYFVY